MAETDADALARLRERYATLKPAPPCPRCLGTMVWDNVWTPRHAPRMVIYVCHYCHQSEHVADGDPEVIRLLDALAAEREHNRRLVERWRGRVERQEQQYQALEVENRALREAVDKMRGNLKAVSNRGVYEMPIEMVTNALDRILALTPAQEGTDGD